MKTFFQIRKEWLTIGLITVTICSAAAFYPEKDQEQAIQTVTITAKKMTAAEKIAFDRTPEVQTAQTVIIRHRRLSAEEKLAADQLEQSVIQSAAYQPANKTEASNSNEVL